MKKIILLLFLPFWVFASDDIDWDKVKDVMESKGCLDYSTPEPLSVDELDIVLAIGNGDNENVTKILQSKGCSSYVPYFSKPIELSAGQFVFQAGHKNYEDITSLVQIKDNIVMPVDAFWSPQSMDMSFIDLNEDGRKNLLINSFVYDEYYVRIYFNEQTGLRKVFDGISQGKAYFFGDLLILSSDPYELGFGGDFAQRPDIYIFTGEVYEYISPEEWKKRNNKSDED